MGFGSYLAHAFNSFVADEKKPDPAQVYMPGMITTDRPDRPRFKVGGERSIITSIYTRMAVDVSSNRIEHVRLDDQGQYFETIDSGLNNCLKVEANLDQAGTHFRRDLAMTILQEGVAAIIPVDTTVDPKQTSGYDIKTLRVGTIVQWYPEHVKVRAYDQRDGRTKEIVLPKTMVAIVENPFYSIMNEPNSTLQRLIYKLSLMDHVDEIASSGKLDIIIQLPYTTKTATREAQAKKRIGEIKDQLKDSTYGIAYAESTEKITQLNRSVENNLLEQVKYLKEQLYAELGLTEAIMNGTADDAGMLNYMNRTIEPIMDAIVEAILRTFLTKTARSQNQSIMYFQSPFKMLPISELAKVTDVLSRNQIVTPNEIRPALGLKPSKSPQANELINSNMPKDMQVTDADPSVPAFGEGEEPDEAELKLDATMKELGV